MQFCGCIYCPMCVTMEKLRGIAIIAKLPQGLRAVNASGKQADIPHFRRAATPVSTQPELGAAAA